MLDSAFVSYVTVMSITPGPNNLLLASSGVNFGLRRTLPMIFGISLGCAAQLALTTVLLALILSWVSAIRFPLAAMGCTYLLWLSWKLFKAASPDAKQQTRPMRLIGGALFQVVNPKAWLMTINVAILFTPHTGVTLSQTLLTIAAFSAVNIPCILVWALVGDWLRHALRVTWKLRLFNGVMAGSMAATALWLLFDEWRAAFA
ncbi:LysE family translocator [Serratia sp. L9]|uniref:LysE family translocator n=1 Tax=Serratia sp. L9 TaxID=3423946 RepID=UPI003D672A5A